MGRYQIILLGDRHVRVSSCPKLLPGSGPAEIRIRDLLGHERTLYRYATQATLMVRLTVYLVSVVSGDDLNDVGLRTVVTEHLFRVDVIDDHVIAAAEHVTAGGT